MKAPRRVAMSVLALLLGPAFARAAVFDRLSAVQRRQVESGAPVVETHDVSGSAWPSITVYRLVNATPAEAAAVFTDYNEQPSYLKECCGVIDAKVIDPAVGGDPKVQRVRYELEVPIVSNERYELREEISKIPGGGYQVSWKKVSKGGHSDDIVGLAMFEPYGGKTLLRYFNFTQISGFGAGLLADQATERTVTTVDRMARHMEQERGAGGPGFQRDLARLRAAFGE